MRHFVWPAGRGALCTYLGVDYVQYRTPDGGDLYLTRFGQPLRELLHPHNWFAPEWFGEHRNRLLGTSVIYRVPTKPVQGRSLNLVVRFSREGEEVPSQTLTLTESGNAEFNCPFEEFALVMQLRAASRRPGVRTSSPKSRWPSSAPPSACWPGKPGAGKALWPRNWPATRKCRWTFSANTSCFMVGFGAKMRCKPPRRWGLSETGVTSFCATSPGGPSRNWRNWDSGGSTSNRSTLCCGSTSRAGCSGGATGNWPTRWWITNAPTHGRGQ